MPFDLSVTISMHFYERCQTKRDVCNFRFEKGDSSSKVRLSVFPLVGGGGGTLIFSCIHRLGLFLGVQTFEFQYYFFGGGGGGRGGGVEN